MNTRISNVFRAIRKFEFWIIFIPLVVLLAILFFTAPGGEAFRISFMRFGKQVGNIGIATILSLIIFCGPFTLGALTGVFGLPYVEKVNPYSKLNGFSRLVIACVCSGIVAFLWGRLMPLALHNDRLYTWFEWFGINTTFEVAAYGWMIYAAIAYLFCYGLTELFNSNTAW